MDELLSDNVITEKLKKNIISYENLIQCLQELNNKNCKEEIKNQSCHKFLFKLKKLKIKKQSTKQVKFRSGIVWVKRVE